MARSRLDGAVVKLLAIVAFAAVAFAHEHDESEIPEGEAVSAEPLDTILWVHIMIQILAWGIIFPTGMVLGVRPSPSSLSNCLCPDNANFHSPHR
jgi:hypothetical protein